MYVPAKSVLTYQMKVPSPVAGLFGGDPVDLEQQVSSLITTNNGFTVIDYQINTSGFFSSQPDQVVMKIRTGNTDFASEVDVQSIVDNAVYQISGNLPASTVVDVTPPSTGGTTSVFNHQTPIPTGQTQTPVNPPSGGDGSKSSWWDSVSTFLNGASTGGILGIGLAVIGMVLLFGYLSERKLLRV